MFERHYMDNQFLKIEAKTRIYKSWVRSIITYAAETTADTSRTKSITLTAENTQPRNKTNLRHAEHCKIDETQTARVESTHQQNERQ